MMQIYQDGVTNCSKSRDRNHMTRSFPTNSTYQRKHEASVTCLIAHEATP
jgi:hypothetical protein